MPSGDQIGHVNRPPTSLMPTSEVPSGRTVLMRKSVPTNAMRSTFALGGSSASSSGSPLAPRSPMAPRRADRSRKKAYSRVRSADRGTSQITAATMRFRARAVSVWSTSGSETSSVGDTCGLSSASSAYGQATFYRHPSVRARMSGRQRDRRYRIDTVWIRWLHSVLSPFSRLRR